MEIIESLSEKVHQAARELIELKNDRARMVSELDALRQQTRAQQTLARENEQLKREQDQLRSRLLRLQKKIDKHLLVEMTLAAQAEGGNDNEEHPQ